MKAAPDQQRRLLTVQEIDTAIDRERAEAARREREATEDSLDREITKARHDHLELLGERDDRRTALSRIESDVAAVEAREARDTARLQTTSSLKDIHGLEAELAALAQRRDHLEDRQLEAMEEIEEADRVLTEAEQALGELESRHRVAEEERSRRAEEQRLHLEALTAERAGAVAGLPADLLGLYDKQRARYGIGAALLRHGVSLGSNTTLNPADMQEIRRAAPDEVILCPESSCILVRTDESGL